MGNPKLTDDCYWFEHGRTATHADVADRDGDVASLPHDTATAVIDAHNAVIERITDRYLEWRQGDFDRIDELEKRVAELESRIAAMRERLEYQSANFPENPRHYAQETLDLDDASAKGGMERDEFEGGT